MCSGGETLRSSKFRHGKTYALELDDEKLACVVLGAIFDLYVWEYEVLSHNGTQKWLKFRVKR